VASAARGSSAIADSVGGHWPDTSRIAALTLTGADLNPAQVRLLMDCRAAFGEAGGLPTATLLDRLRGDDEAPWAGLSKVGLTAARLARMLQEFGIASANRRWPDGSQTKGYVADDFVDSWARYCATSSSAPMVTSVTYPCHPRWSRSLVAT
jgi:Protein of unknown function (DUF3631)